MMPLLDLWLQLSLPEKVSTPFLSHPESPPLIISQGYTVVRGSGQVKQEARSVSSFRGIRLTGIGQVSVRQTGQESLSVEAEDNILPLLQTKVVNEILILDVRNNTTIQPTAPIRYDIEVKQLDQLQLSGAGSMEVLDLSTPALSVSISGTGELTLAGEAEELEVGVSGTGELEAQNLITQRAEVNSRGVGEAIIHTQEDLKVNISGVGSVRYLGTPRIQQSISGLGTIRPYRP
ncbi:MAG: DUF2807 domain-containing protein [Synechococcaceae cyanobacterium SM2_3_1]|nr:DUF2807 domain-containing protein [Synechococcaceae cyanobacterium SM2_3_1]